MKILFTVFLVLNLLAETMAAVALIGGPQGVSALGQIEGGMWAMTYGFGVIAIASAILWIWPYRSNLPAVTAVLGMLMTFHVCLFAALTLAGDQQAGEVIHGVLALFSIALFATRGRWCAD